MPLVGIALIGAGFRTTAARKKQCLTFILACMMFSLIVLAACGGGSPRGIGVGGGNGGGNGGKSGGTPPGTYTITIAGSATGLPTQPTTVTLTVQ
jgi:hypothetical protein